MSFAYELYRAVQTEEGISTKSQVRLPIWDKIQCASKRGCKAEYMFVFIAPAFVDLFVYFPCTG